MSSIAEQSHLKKLLRTSPRYMALLEQAGITSVKEFLQYFPRTYEDRADIKGIQALDLDGEVESVRAQVVDKKRIPLRSSKKLYEITIQDAQENQATISIFNSYWMYKSYEIGKRYIITGKAAYKYKKITFSHPDATTTNPPNFDEEAITSDDTADDNRLHDLEQELYRITKDTSETIDDDNLLFLEFLKQGLIDHGYNVTQDTHRSLLISTSKGQKVLLAPKASHLSINQGYKGLAKYCQTEDLDGGLLYYSDTHKRLKIIRYQSSVTNNNIKNKKQDSPWNIGRIYPIYSELLGISPSWIARNMRKAIQEIPQHFKEYLPQEFLEKFDLLGVHTTLQNIHFPDSEELQSLAQERVYFDRLLRIQLHNLLEKQKYSSLEDTTSTTPTQSQAIDYSIVQEFTETLPFELTTAQKKVIKECIEDLHTPGNKKMMRLLQGDVGSGKTVVAATIAYYLKKQFGQQIVFLAPLSILAKQHYQSLAKLFLPLGLRVELLEGSKTKKEKDKIKEQMKVGQIDILVGTQAILQDDVSFHDLGLAVVDEQHKFGVNQRAFFTHHGAPHIIQMSATPIPRSLALTFFGEFDVSIIDELPAGRKAITTKIIDHNEWKKLAPWLAQKIDQGQKIFVVAPLIEESDNFDLANVTEVFEATQQLLPDHQAQIGLLHGRMKASEKDTIMKDFASGNYAVLVSTTVIEVGVDIPEASVMIIYNAERFGLSQLHQLRGRIGRSDISSHCFLETTTKSGETYERLQAMEDTQDGFKLAQIDLQYRGAGEILGTKQSGQTDLPIEILTNVKFIEKVRNGALWLLKKHPQLDDLPALKQFVEEDINNVLA